MMKRKLCSESDKSEWQSANAGFRLFAHQRTSCRLTSIGSETADVNPLKKLRFLSQNRDLAVSPIWTALVWRKSRYSPLLFFPAPPSYEECVQGKVNINDEGDSEYTQGQLSFAPVYPFYPSLMNAQPSAPVDPAGGAGYAARF